jgi:hypothetical protein
MLSFIPVGVGTVQTVVSMSTDSGKTWVTQIDGYNKVFPCGRKSNIRLRVHEGDKPGVAFKITGRQYKPVITGKPKLIYYPDPVPGAVAAVPVVLQCEDSSKGYAAVEKVYWDGMGDGVWDDSTELLNWIWKTNVPQGDLGQRKMVIAKARDVYGSWNNSETLMVQFGGMRGTVFYEDFENGLLNWERIYQVTNDEIYSQMCITSDVAHTSTHSLTTDSSMTALYYVLKVNGLLERIEDGIAGVEFYMMTHALDEVNFGVELGQNPGSSGRVSPAFGIFFDPSDSIKCTVFSSYPITDSQKMIAPIIVDHWYKCNVEVNFSDSITSFYIDGALVHTERNPKYFYGIDRLSILRGKYGKNGSLSSEGKKEYYVDNISLYTK